MKVSKTGYKKNSKDKNEPALVIPSNKITMKGVEFPVLGTDNTGYSQLMYPGLDYSFPGSYVHEIPMAQDGYILPGRFKNPEGNWLTKYDDGGPKRPGDITRVATPASHFSIGYTSNPNIIYFHDTATDTWTKFNEQQTANFKKTNPSYFTAPAPTPKPAAKPAPKPAPKPVAKPAPQPVAKPAAKPVAKVAPAPAPKPTPAPAPAPVSTSRVKGPGYWDLAYKPEETVQESTRYFADPFIGKQTEAQQIVKEAEQAKVPVAKVAQQKAKQQEEKKRLQAEEAKRQAEAEAEQTSILDPIQQGIDTASEYITENIYNPINEKFGEALSGLDRLLGAYVEEEDPTSIIPPTEVKKEIKPEDTTKYGYKHLYTVPDSNHPSDSLVSFTNTFNNDEGARYYVGHKANEVTSGNASSKFENARAVAHFLRDSDILPNQKIAPKSWNVGGKDYEMTSTSPGKALTGTGYNDPERYRMAYKPNPDGSYNIKYIKTKDLTPEFTSQYEVDLPVSGQHKFSDIDWEGEGKKTGFAAWAKKTKYLPLKKNASTIQSWPDKEATRIPYKDKNSFSRFSGGSIVYIFKDPATGKQIGIDVSGSVNTMKKIGDNIISTYKIKPEDLELVYHDMGSYSAKPKAHGTTLDYDQWLDYNQYNKGFSGAPLVIPAKAYGGDISIPDLSRPNWLSKYQKGGNKLSEDAIRKGYTWSDEFGFMAPEVTVKPTISPEGIKALLDREAAMSISPADKSTGDYIKQGLNIATRPLTALGYKIRGQEIPWNFTQGDVNPMDYPLQFLGAASAVKSSLPYLNTAAQVGSKVLPGVTAGNAIGAGFAADALVNRLPQIPGQLNRGEYLDAGVNALTGGLDLYTAGMVSPLYKGAKSLLKRGPKEVTPDFSRFQTQYWPAEPTPKESLDLEKLRTIYHNRDRVLNLQEMYDLNHYGHGDMRNYLTSARRAELYGNMLPPPPSTIDLSTGTARLNYNQLPVSSAYDELPEDVFRRFTQGNWPPNIDPAGNIDLLLPSRDRVISTSDDFDSAVEEWMRSNGMAEAQMHPDFPTDIPNRLMPILDRYNLNNLSSEDLDNAVAALSNEQRQNLFRDMYQELPNLFTQQEIRRMQIPSRSGFSNATISQPRNASGFTREQLLQKTDPSQHEKITNMTDEQFAKTVLKPTGEVTESVKGPDVTDMTYDIANGRMVLKDATPIGKDEYAKIFNDNIDILNNLIRSKYNKTGVDYEVSHLDPAGRLVFKTKEIPVKTKAPKEFEEAMSKLNSSDPKEHDKVLTELTDLNGETFYQFNGILTPRFYSKQEAKQWLDDAINTLTKETTVPGGTTSWSVNINPALWRGQVKDIPNTEYFKSIPGLDMSITSNSVFSDLKPRKGSGAYAAINEYLKMLDLGRVKPGFNSQTAYSQGAWENFIKSGRGYGFYNFPSVVHGAMKTVAPYAIPTAAGAALLQKEKYGGVKSSAEGYYDYINGYSGIFAKGGADSKKTSWLNKYK